MKPDLGQKTAWAALSPPARGRGLKQALLLVYDTLEVVAPRAGAWIETEISLTADTGAGSRPPRGGVD